MQELITIAVVSGIILIALAAIGLIFARLYQRASKELSFVRTGFGGQKIIMNGGALVLPVLHEIIHVNMNTLRLSISRINQQALITKDRMRVDVTCEFYVRVKPDANAIATAAQTLGQRTMKPDLLKELVEGKFVDALRAVAAEMTMEELHEKRVEFVQRVQQAVSVDLDKNGLELESASLTGLDQTSRDFFNPDNAFDAEGLTKLTEIIEGRRKKRNDIEQETSVAIQHKNLDAERQRLFLTRDEEYAKLEQQRELEIRRAAQASEIAREQAERQREAEQARILSEQQVKQSEITSHKAIEEERIAMEQMVRTREVEKARAVEAADIDKRKNIELAEQDRAIAIAERSKSQSVAQADADRARADAVQAEEEVLTVRETAQAERQKAIDLVEARKKAERDAITIVVAAEAEKQASQDYAESVRIKAMGESDQARIIAEGQAAAEKLAAEAAAKRYEVEAVGRRALNDAANVLRDEQISMEVKLALIKGLPEIIQASTKPMEQIDSIKIVQVDGLSGAPKEGGAGGYSQGSLADQVVNSALRYRSQAPLLDSLLEEIGLKGSELNGLTKGIFPTDSATPATSEGTPLARGA